MIEVKPSLVELATKAEALYKSGVAPAFSLENTAHLDACYLDACQEMIRFSQCLESRPCVPGVESATSEA